MMTAADVLEVTGWLQAAGLRCWLDGGWGVDALVGKQTRPHDDLDIVVELSRVDQVIAELAPLGYRLTLDERPTRLVLAGSADRRIDLHPITLDAEGNGRQAGAGPGGGDAVYPSTGLAGSGSVGGRPLRCLTPRLLLLHHTGYTPQPGDRHNVQVLCESFDLDPPAPYTHR